MGVEGLIMSMDNLVRGVDGLVMNMEGLVEDVVECVVVGVRVQLVARLSY